MLPNFKKSELSNIGKILFRVPFLIKYYEVESKRIPGLINKGYKLRMINPITWIIFIIAFIHFVIFYMYDGGIKEMKTDIGEFFDMFTF